MSTISRYILVGLAVTSLFWGSSLAHAGTVVTDEEGRVVEEIHDDGTATRYIYDAKTGELIAIVHPDGTVVTVPAE